MNIETGPRHEEASEKNQEGLVEEKEKIVKDRMLAIQLEYALKLSEGEIPFLDGEKKVMDFETAVENYTRVPRMIRDAYTQKTGRWDLEDNEEYFAAAQRIKTEIMQEYGQNQDLDALSLKINEIIAATIKEIPAGEAKKDSRQEAGLLHYYIMKSGRRELEDYGVDKNGTYLDLHFEALFKQKNEQGKAVNLLESWKILQESLHGIAIDIAEKCPEIKAVIGASWVLDPKVGLSREMGFKGLKPVRGTGFSQGNGFWGQFIDFNGQIKENEVQRFLKTGKPKYKLTVGYIPIDEFLEKYGKE